MYHSKRQRHNAFNMRKHARNHNTIERDAQHKANLENEKHKMNVSFSKLMSKCVYNEFKITSKIHYNKFKYMRVIPKGKKICVWFQSQHMYNACIHPALYFEQTRNKGKYVLMDGQNADFNICCQYDEVSGGQNGTVVYGTLFKYNGVQYFNVENIHYFKNECVTNAHWDIKFSYIHDLFSTYIKQLGYTTKDIIFISCLTYSLPHDIISAKNMVPYPLYSIQYLFPNSDKVFFKSELYQEEAKHYQQQQQQHHYNKKTEFLIRASINHDEYDVYSIDDNKWNGKLYVPDFKTSVYLNSIFRNIRENENLDLLEESEPEDEFENIEFDKFVDLNKTSTMRCVYNKNVDLWMLSM